MATNEVDQAHEDPYQIKYRPRELDQVIGNQMVVNSLASVLKARGVPHTFLFVGPSGVGKTTLARIVASMLDIPVLNIMDINGASNRGIENMRQVVEQLKYRALGTNPKRMIILDECHALTKDTWQSLLLPIEQPPKHVYWALCTTELSKVPVTIQTRCAKFELKSIAPDELYDLVSTVSELEELSVPASVLDVCVERADGSARLALQNLQVARVCENNEQAIELLSRRLDNAEAIDLARLLCDPVKCRSWATVAKCLKKASEKEPPETIRLIVVNYAAKALLGGEGGKPMTDMKRATHLLFVLEQFSGFFPEQEKYGPLLVAVGRIVLGG